MTNRAELERRLVEAAREMRASERGHDGKPGSRQRILAASSNLRGAALALADAIREQEKQDD